MIGQDNIITRTYTGRETDFGMLEIGVGRFEAFLRDTARAEGGSQPTVTPHFEVITGSTKAELDGIANFSSFRSERPDFAKEFRVRLECAHAPGVFPPDGSAPAVVEIDWSRYRIIIKVSHFKSPIAQDILKIFKEQFKVEPLGVPPEHSVDPGIASNVIERTYAGGGDGWGNIAFQIEGLQSMLKQDEPAVRDGKLVTVPRYSATLTTGRVASQSGEQFFKLLDPRQVVSCQASLERFERQLDGSLLPLSPGYLYYEWDLKKALLRVCGLEAQRALPALVKLEKGLQLRPVSVAGQPDDEEELEPEPEPEPEPALEDLAGGTDDGR